MFVFVLLCMFLHFSAFRIVGVFFRSFSCWVICPYVIRLVVCFRNFLDFVRIVSASFPYISVCVLHFYGFVIVPYLCYIFVPFVSALLTILCFPLRRGEILFATHGSGSFVA
jgi:hypothetical protein